MTRYERAPYIDQYAEDGELVVMLADMRVAAVSAVAARVLVLLDEHGTLEEAEVVAALAQVPDLPPADDLAMSVSGLLGSLEGAGMLGLPGSDPGLR